jgi:hypothetical protein
MTIASSTRCKACNSPHRPEIDQRLLAGESTRAVAEWLESLSEEVSYVSLARHKLEHCNASAEARAQLEASRPAFQDATAKIVADVRLLDEVAGLAIHHARRFKESPPSSQADATVFAASLREARAAVVARHEILHGKKVNVDATVTGLADLLGLALKDDDGESGSEGGRA